MEITIKTQKENQLLQRKEITGEAAFSGATPSNKEVKEAIAKKLNTDAGTIAVKKITGSFGGINAKIEAFAYSTKEQLEKIEPKQKPKQEGQGKPAK